MGEEAGSEIDLQDGPRDDRNVPERTCVATRLAQSADALIRLVVSPDGVLTPDLRRKLPGRGVWVSLSREAVLDAQKRRCFERSLKAKVQVPPALADEIDALMARDCLQSLAMANKAGLVTSGFAKVESKIDGGHVVAVIEASDGAEDGKRKIAQALHRSAGETTRRVAIVTDFAAVDLELALGRQHVIHAALASGPATDGFLGRWRRLVQYRTNPLPPRGAITGSDTAADTKRQDG
ncbi:MAG: RNA-binding protein [Bosea sp. (in: a-proteobacteria)]